MPTQPYKLKDGTRVSGVTTIISGVQLGGVEGLLYWANKEGLEGRNYKDSRQSAADAGTCAHAMVEASIHGTMADLSAFKTETVERAKGAFDAYLKWATQTKLQAVQTELPLVSEVHRYGGTLDAVLVDGELAIGDWKTSNSIRASMLLQLAAYGELWNEHHPDQPITGGYHLIRFSKQEQPDDPVHFSHHHWTQLDLARDMFLRMVPLYYDFNRLRKML